MSQQNGQDQQDLPEGWNFEPLGETVKKVSDKVDPTEIAEMPYIGLDKIEEDQGQVNEIGSSSEVKSAKTRFQPDDILYGRLRPYLNKVWRADREGICSTDIYVLRTNGEVDPEFLKRRLLSQDFVRYANGEATGDRPRVSFNKISEFEIGVPPKHEQKQIVEKIEELFSKLDAGVDDLDTVETQLERYRQSVLKSAVEGKLTEEWREKNKINIESANNLVRKINEIKSSLYEKGKIRKPKDLPQIENDEIPSELPDKWCWERLGNIFLMFNGDRGENYPSREDQVEEGIPFFSTKNIEDNKINLDPEQLNFITKERFHKLKRGKVENGDFLMVLRGSVGKFGIFRSNDKYDTGFINAQQVILRPLENLNGYYLTALFHSPVFKNQLDRAASGSAQPQLSATALSKIILPIPPAKEQEKVSTQIEQSLSIVNNSKKVIENEQKRSTNLRQSILKKAFEGELV